MNRSTPSLLKPNLFLTTLLGSVILASCGAAPSEMPQSSAPVPAAKEASAARQK